LTKFAAASTTSYGYNGDGLRMCKYAGSSSQPCQQGGATQFLWDVAGSLPLLLKDGSTAYVYGPGGLPVEQVTTSATYWFHHDQIGSTRLVTNLSGGPSATYTFDPYGGLASSTNPGGITNPFGFSGQYQDSESSLYYFRARYYDAGTGQFVTRDQATGMTRQPYEYVADNPLNRLDPAGLCDWNPFSGNSCTGQAWNQVKQSIKLTPGDFNINPAYPFGSHANLAATALLLGGLYSIELGAALIAGGIASTVVVGPAGLIISIVGVAFVGLGVVMVLGAYGQGPLGNVPGGQPQSSVNYGVDTSVSAQSIQWNCG
jgi:RHS repeat-associated protein